jgi:hypothetical protein
MRFANERQRADYSHFLENLHLIVHCEVDGVFLAIHFAQRCCDYVRGYLQFVK